MKHLAIAGQRGRHYLITLSVIVLINFMLPRLMPGDPFSSEEDVFDQAYSDNMTQEQLLYLKHYYNLDQPLASQLVGYLWKLVHGDMGYSLAYKEKVSTLIMQRLPWTLLMVLGSLLLSSALGTLLGAFSAWNRNRYIDQWLYPIIILWSEIPSFVIGLILLCLFSIYLHWFPMAGSQTPFSHNHHWFYHLINILYYATLPLLTLTFSKLGRFYLLARNSMLTILAKDYITTARAKGLKSRAILYRHALRNAMLPIITRIFMSLGSLFSGAIIVENIFAYPGVGTLMGSAISNRDYVLLQGIFIFISVSILTMNLLSDLIYKKLDPRISL
ncbi:ABC transporter permease [Celerinatantimonas sp. YJH-8]|uniref:ABC transporter permease n=1 Tax=Celerinatantimonas sp. YJH-8 TaxID=3228714 RepID=UPI0038C2B7C6